MKQEYKKQQDKLKGVTPNKAQRRPDLPKHSPPKKFNLYRSQGK